MKRLLPLLALLSCAIPARATLSVNAATEHEVTTGATCVDTVTVSAGHLVAIFSRQGVNNTTNMTVSDSAGGNTWTQTASGYATVTSTSRAAFFFSSLTNGVTSVTTTWGTISGRIACDLYDITGAATSSIEDSSVNSTDNNSTTSMVSGSLTTTNANDILLFGVSVAQNEASFTADTGNGYAIQTGASGNRVTMEYKIVSATQSGVTTTVTFPTASTSKIGIFAAFKASGAGPPPCSPTMTLLGVGRCG